MITDFEKWDPEHELSIRLYRMYASNVFNLYILALSYLFLANPFILPEDALSVRSHVESKFTSTLYQCRLDQVASELFAQVQNSTSKFNTVQYSTVQYIIEQNSSVN